MSKKLANRRVVITGAGSGLGQTSAQLFARQGAELILVDINAKGMEETSVLVEKEGSRSTSHVCDVAIESEIQRLGEQLCNAYPKIDVLYNNAGIAYGEINQMVNTINQEKWLRYLAINTIAPLLIAEVLRSSLASAKGLIINQSSIASYAPATVYGVTKAALNSLTYGMANVYSEDGIRVNAIAPGIMETAASKQSLSQETYDRVQAMQLSDLHGKAEDIANLAIFLASEEGRFINCEIVNCDAGSRLRGWRA